MPERIVHLRDAFGVGRDVPLNYVARENVDESFLGSLTRDKHVVVYGSSKQGKTTLRRHCLEEDDYIVVSCLNTMSLSDLHGAILKRAGYKIEQTQTKTVGGNWTYGAEFTGEGKVPFFAKASGSGKASHEATGEQSTSTIRLEIDLSDVNDVIIALNEAQLNKFIILEDFHYLPGDTQHNFSFALKSFHENSKLCFIVIGVWRDKNRLIYYNGDLTNRVVSIDVDLWSHDQLVEVISASEYLLNIKFDESTVKAILLHCSDSVSLVQEVCYRICERENILQTQEENTHVGVGVDADALIREIVNDQAGRYQAFVTNFAEGFQDTDLEMYKWLMIAVLKSTTEELESGLRRGQISSSVKALHPLGKQLNEGNITQALQNAASLQVLKKIRPIIIDYDQTTRVLNIVDKSFLIWLEHQNIADLLLELGVYLNMS